MVPSERPKSKLASAAFLPQAASCFPPAAQEATGRGVPRAAAPLAVYQERGRRGAEERRLERETGNTTPGQGGDIFVSRPNANLSTFHRHNDCEFHPASTSGDKAPRTTEAVVSITERAEGGGSQPLATWGGSGPTCLLLLLLPLQPPPPPPPCSTSEREPDSGQRASRRKGGSTPARHPSTNTAAAGHCQTYCPETRRLGRQFTA